MYGAFSSPIVVVVRKCSMEVFKGFVRFVTAFCLVNINLELWTDLIFKHDVHVLWKKCLCSSDLTWAWSVTAWLVSSLNSILTCSSFPFIALLAWIFSNNTCMGVCQWELKVLLQYYAKEVHHFYIFLMNGCTASVPFSTEGWVPAVEQER